MSGVTQDLEFGAATALTVATMGAAAPLIGLAAAGGVAASAIAQNNMPSSTPNLQAPDALSSTPTQAQANTTALQTQLAKEQQASPTATYMGVTGGLLDQPTTQRPTLMGT